MTFKYPVVVTPHKDDEGFHAEFVDLEGCYADGRDLNETLDNIKAEGDTWIAVELEEFDGDLPMVTYPEDVEVEEGQFVRMIMLRYKLLPDSE